LKQPDPPIYASDGDSMQANSVSAFALFVLVYDAQFRHIWCQLHAADPNHLHHRFQTADLPQQYWGSEGIEFLEANDTILMFGMGGAFANCRTEAAYEELVCEFGDRVERY
jgi:hypothetical protein